MAYVRRFRQPRSPELVRNVQQIHMNARNRNISLRGLRTFCLAAEQQSFRDAADKLFITASAVSHQIRNLEEELGQKLFDRAGRSLSLTETGRSLLADVQPLILELDEIASRYRNGVARTSMSISVQPFFASELFIPRLPEFTAAHPEIDIKVDTSDESAEKHPGSADVSIRVFKSPPEGLAADRLFPLRLIPAASRAFRDSMVVNGKRIVSDFPLIVHDNRPKAWRQWARSSGIELPEDTHVIRLDSMIAVARAAERGLGAALVPVQLTDSWFDAGDLVPLFDHQLTTRDAYYLVSKKSDADLDTVRLIRDWVLQEFGDAQ